MSNTLPTSFYEDERMPDVLPPTDTSLAPYGGIPERLNPRDFLAYLEANVTPDQVIADRVGLARLSKILGRAFYTGERRKDLYNLRDFDVRNVDMEDDMGLLPNPAPVIQVSFDEGSFVGSHYESFLLKEPSTEPRHRYYVPAWSVRDDSSVLRPEDIVPSGTFTSSILPETIPRICEELQVTPADISQMIYECDPSLKPYYTTKELPFDKYLMRVPVAGGAEERYNYVDGAWEQTGGMYNAGFRRRAIEKVRSTLGALPFGRGSHDSTERPAIEAPEL